MKKVIVAGSSKKQITKIGFMWLDEYYNVYGIDELVCGMAPGIDSDAYRWAKSKGIKIKEFPAEWQNFDLPLVKIKYRGDYKYNALAGIYRNGLMADYATHALIYPGRNGTNDMYKRACKNGLEITDLRDWDELVFP